MFIRDQICYWFVAGSAWFVAINQTAKSPGYPLGGSCSDGKTDTSSPSLKDLQRTKLTIWEVHTVKWTDVKQNHYQNTTSCAHDGNSEDKKEYIYVSIVSAADHSPFLHKLHWSVKTVYSWPDIWGCIFSLSTLLPWHKSCHWKVFPSFWKAKVRMPQD